MKPYFLAVFFLAAIPCFQTCYGQENGYKAAYEKAYSDIKEALDSNIVFTFKEICFVTENTYLNGQLDFLKFNTAIGNLKAMAVAWMNANPLKNYPYNDSNNFHKNYAIYKVLADTIRFINNDSEVLGHLPFLYDFEDWAGENHWENMFVTKLLATKKGNCHGLPYLYKILADEMGATCWLTLAPNHIYISNRCKKIGWYNTELTSGTFPIDAWIMASGYLPLQAVQNGIYMDTLSNQASIALCVLDLAKGYEHKTANYYDGFILKCCDLSLKYFPLNIQALLLKAETLKRVYQRQAQQRNKAAKGTYRQMESLYVRLFNLGYREMPEKMYMDWLQSINKERAKYQDGRINETIHLKAG